jgi:hypothetical protein
LIFFSNKKIIFFEKVEQEKVLIWLRKSSTEVKKNREKIQLLVQVLSPF